MANRVPAGVSIRAPIRAGWARRLRVAGLLTLAAACVDGPEAPSPGIYRLLALSGSRATLPEVSLTVEPGGRMVFEAPAAPAASVRWGEPGPSVVVCPPRGRGRPRPLGRAIVLGSLGFDRPAVFGDCGVTRPVRLTVVDLASARSPEEGSGWARWAEFCPTADPDCPDAEPRPRAMQGSRDPGPAP